MQFQMKQQALTGFESYYNTFLFENDLIPLFPEIFLLTGTTALLIYGVIYSTSVKQGYPLILTNVNWLGQLILGLTLVMICKAPTTNHLYCYNTLVNNETTHFLKPLIIICTWVALAISIDYLKKEGINIFEYVILVLLSCGSMMFLISSQDLITLYLGIELQSLCFYVLAASKRNSEFSTEAGLKYMILGGFSSGVLLFGCSLIYGFTGLTNFSELSQLLTFGSDHSLVEGNTLSLRGCHLGITFVLVGLLFKITAAPFHMWAPDVYEGAPTPVTAFFSLTPKIGVLAVMSRLFLESFYDLLSGWQGLILVSSLASMSIGALAALSQNKIKRLLAYSSIGHVGYMIAGVSCGTVEGIQGVIIYLFIYLVMTAAFFSLILSPLRLHTKQNSFIVHGNLVQTTDRIKYNNDFALLSKTNPLLAITLAVTLFSMAGIPPLAGFYSKAYLFLAALGSNLYSLALVGVLASVVSCFYYIRIIKIMYFEKPRDYLSFYRIDRTNSLVIAASLLFLVIFIAYPSPLYLASQKVALSLCG